MCNCIGQFVTILSVNKTREFFDGRNAPIFCAADGVTIRIFSSKGVPMDKKTKKIVQAATIAALYVVLTHLQNIILPSSTTAAIQCRLSEALTVLAFFSPAAVPGLTLGCLVFNITSGAALPLDFLVGSLATFLAAVVMRSSRNLTVRGLPILGLVMPALTNSVLVGWELSVYIGGGFWYNAICVAIGELIVLFTAGVLLYTALKRRRLDSALFS